MSAPHILFVLGMHRSGTSALTRALNMVGAGLPDNLLPPCSDNVTGYWESLDLVALNNALLTAAGTAWHDDAAIPDDWLRSDVPRPLVERALALLNAAQAAGEPLALKDPRLCRVLPFWKRVLSDLSLTAHYVLILRHPAEVFQSFQARWANPQYRVAAIVQQEKCDLVWLRHVIEAERQTRDCSRNIITYDALLQNPGNLLAEILRDAGMSADPLDRTTMAAIEDFVSGRHRRQAVDRDKDSDQSLAAQVFRLCDHSVRTGIALDTARLDNIHRVLDSVTVAYAPLREATSLAVSAQSRWPVEVLAQVSLRLTKLASRPRRVIYVSGFPDIPSHRYRVLHPMDALRQEGIETAWYRTDQAPAIEVQKGDIVIMVRAPWSEALACLHARCRAIGVPVGFDIDDLVFDSQLMNVQHIDFLRIMNADERRVFAANCANFERTLKAADFALLTTQPLAMAAARYLPRCYVLPNGVGDEMVRAANAALPADDAKPSHADGMIRIGYASGTRSHQRDFAVVAPVLEKLLAERRNVMLTLVGYIGIREFPFLKKYSKRVELRPPVEHMQLFREYARFDINLAPLERGNPFCEAKSQLKYFEPALVEIPTAASATVPFAHAISNGETGFLAVTHADWYAVLTFLADNPAERQRIGKRARVHARAAFGPELRRALLVNIMGNVAATHSPAAN